MFTLYSAKNLGAMEHHDAGGGGLNLAELPEGVCACPNPLGLHTHAFPRYRGIESVGSAPSVSNCLALSRSFS